MIRGLVSIIIVFFMTLITNFQSDAGQVVTKDLMAWASKVVAQEKKLGRVAGKRTVAVLYFINNTSELSLDPLQKGFALMLITDLAKVKDINVVERVRLQALMEELALATSGLIEPGTGPRLGRLLRAQWIVGGELSGSKAKLDVNAHLIKVANEKILGSPASRGSLSKIFKMEKEILFEIIRLLKIKLKPVEVEELKRPMSTNVDALMAFFKGIDASDRHKYLLAAKYYKEALKKDKKLDIARAALEELKRLGLIPAVSKSRLLLKSLKEQASLTDRLTPEYPVKRMRSPAEVVLTVPEGGSTAGQGGTTPSQPGGSQPSSGVSGPTGPPSTEPQPGGTNTPGVEPNLPPDYGATIEPSRPTEPPSNRPGAF